MVGMFCIIWFLIDRDDWRSKLAEVLVGFKHSIMLNPPTDHIFQSAMSVMIFDAYVQSVSGVLLPLHGCWQNETYSDNIDNRVGSAFQYVF